MRLLGDDAMCMDCAGHAVAQACETLGKSKSAVQTIIAKLMKAGLVRKTGTVNEKACYEKT